MHAADRADPEPKALACYGLWLPARARMLLRLVDGRPVSRVTCAFLAWVAEQLAVEGARVLALAWDNAAWHVSREVRGWLRQHNRAVKAAGRGCRLLAQTWSRAGTQPRTGPPHRRRRSFFRLYLPAGQPI
jgi:hypothetical protein